VREFALPPGKGEQRYARLTKSEGSTPSTEAIEVRDESDESLFRVRMAAKLEVQRIKEDRLS
jgi:hypothetical protein